MQLPVTWHALLATILSVLGLALGFDGIQPESCTYRKWSREGSVKLLVVAGLHVDGTGSCVQCSSNAVQGLVALDWMLAKLNGNLTGGESYIPGVTLGYDLYDNWDNPDVTTDLLYSGSMAGQQMQCTGQAGTQEQYAAILSLSDIESSHMISRLTQPTVMLRPLPAAPGLEEQAGVIQNVASFQLETQAMVAFLLHHHWNLVIVVHAADRYGRDTSAHFRHAARASNICIQLQAEPTQQTVQDIFTTMQTAINSTLVVVFLGNQPSAQGFVQLTNAGFRPHASRIIWLFPSLIDTKPSIKTEDFLFAIQYPTLVYNDFSKYYNDVRRNVTDSPLHGIVASYGNLVQTNKISHVVDTVLSVAYSVKQASCNSGQSCDNMYDVMKRSRVSISEEFQNEFLPDSYQGLDSVINYTADGFQDFPTLLVTDGTKQVGSFSSKQGGFLSEVTFPGLSSACEGVCPNCCAQQSIRYSYLGGDVLILGLFSLRTYGDTPYSCGVYRGTRTDTISVSAFMEYISSRRQTEAINYGGIALDDCYNGLNTTHVLAELFSKRMVIQDPVTGADIDFDKVVLIVGALSSPVSITVADFATSIGLPMISYGASTPELDNRNRYPFFFRTVPSDTNQVEGILNLIGKLGVTHVGAVYIDDSYGRTGILKLKEKAVARHICVEEPLPVTQAMTDDQLKDVIDTLYVQQVRVVVYFSIDSIAESLLQQMPDSDDSRPPLIFIASEAWGKNQNVISKDLGKKAIGTVVFNIANRIDPNQVFKQYLQNLKFNEKKHNRWIHKLFEDYNKCNLITSFEKIPNVDGDMKLCGADLKDTLSPASVESLNSDQRVVHIAHAIHAAIEGFKAFCPPPASLHGCRTKVRLDTASYVSFISGAQHHDEALFDRNHNGNIGFTIYNIQLQEDSSGYSYDYIQVGSYSTSGQLLLTRQPVFYNDFQKNISLRDVDETDCTKYEATCSSVCLMPTTSRKPEPPSTTIQPQEQKGEESNTMLVITIVLAVLLGILGIALVLIIVVLLRRSPNKDNQGYSMEHRRSVDNTYAVVSAEGHYSIPSSTRSAGHVIQRTSKPIEYSDIRHLSYPDLRVNHVRQMSSPEVLQTTTFSTTPTGKTNRKSPATRRMLRPKSKGPGGTVSDSMTPKTPLSAAAQNASTLDRNFRYKQESFPRFRYPSSQSESGYIYPTEEPPLAISRGEGERSRADTDPESRDPDPHMFSSYITPQAGASYSPKAESKITYLTAKDLVHDSSDEEEDFVESVESADDTGYLSANPSSVINEPHSDTVLNKYAYNPNLQSPSDNEVSKINFPESAASPKSLAEMPDVLRHRPREEEEEDVFII